MKYFPCEFLFNNNNDNNNNNNNNNNNKNNKMIQFMYNTIS